MVAELRRTIWPIFLGEATENLREIGAAILALETASEVGRAELVRGACRLAHSLKGSAASLGLEEFAGLAHALEDALLSAGIAPGASIIEAALRATEALEAALGRGGRDGDDRIPGLPELVAALGELRRHQPGRSRPPSCGPCFARRRGSSSPGSPRSWLRTRTDRARRRRASPACSPGLPPR